MNMYPVSFCSYDAILLSSVLTNTYDAMRCDAILHDTHEMLVESAVWSRVIERENSLKIHQNSIVADLYVKDIHSPIPLCTQTLNKLMISTAISSLDVRHQIRYWKEPLVQ
jgi:hypothetical protein